MSAPYSRKMISKAKALATELNVEVKDGVYFGLQGPTFETLGIGKILGADCVGMSTVPEVIVARHMDVRLLEFPSLQMGNEEESIFHLGDAGLQLRLRDKWFCYHIVHPKSNISLFSSSEIAVKAMMGILLSNSLIL
jgi:hypothetical protein